KPPIHLCQHLPGFRPFALLLPQTPETRGRPQLQGFGLLALGDGDGLTKTLLHVHQRCGAFPSLEQQLTFEPIQLRLVAPLTRTVHVRERLVQHLLPFVTLALVPIAPRHKAQALGPPRPKRAGECGGRAPPPLAWGAPPPCRICCMPSSGRPCSVKTRPRPSCPPANSNGNPCAVARVMSASTCSRATCTSRRTSANMVAQYKTCARVKGCASACARVSAVSRCCRAGAGWPRGHGGPAATQRPPPSGSCTASETAGWCVWGS